MSDENRVTRRWQWDEDTVEPDYDPARFWNKDAFYSSSTTTVTTEELDDLVTYPSAILAVLLRLRILRALDPSVGRRGPLHQEDKLPPGTEP